jgi:hypothetical protein
MTEAEWLACTNPHLMLDSLRGKASERKVRMFACACCRILRHLFLDDRLLLLLQAHNLKGLQALLWVCDWYTAALMGEQGEEQVDALLAARGTARTVASAAGDALSVRRAEAEMLRDVFGNPFRTVTIDPTWLTWDGGTVRNLARSIYDQRAFDRLPILADALEEAGCTDPDILGHCRQPGEHARGCWVLDLVLGRG